MRLRVFFSLVAAGLAATALATASGAGALKVAKVGSLDLSTRSAVIDYLRTIHVDPTGLVIQRGLRNYAGPSCPGRGWTCTSTAHAVVQVASAAGRNTFSCSSRTCAVVQVARAAAADNTAKCIKITGLTQSCTINQSSASSNNIAVVYEAEVGALAPTQTASQTASITQQATGPANTNTACVSHNVVVDGSTAARSTPINVVLEAHQTLTVKQDSTNGGNAAQSSATLRGDCDTGHPLTQRQILNSIAVGRGPITQSEDATNAGPNMAIDVEQNQSAGFLGSAHGRNAANFNQASSLIAVADTPAGPVVQTQSSAAGGLLGTVNQDSRDVSTATATQTETQCDDAHTTASIRCDHATQDAPAYSLTQTQFGPVKKGLGTATQTDNSADTFTINQSSTQDNDTGSGQTNLVQGDCSTSGSCTVSQNTNVDGQTHTNTQSGQEVSTTTACSGSQCTTPEIVFDGIPGTGAPPSTLGPYEMTPFGADPQPSCSGEGSFVTSVEDPAGTITFDEALEHATITNPETATGCWQTWSNGYLGDVYRTDTASNPNQVTITLPPGTNAFYLYGEPNVLSPVSMTATSQDGTTSGPVTVDGNGGARYFGFYGTGGATIASVTVTADPGAEGFAIGEFGINTGEIIG